MHAVAMSEMRSKGAIFHKMRQILPYRDDDITIGISMTCERGFSKTGLGGTRYWISRI